MPGDKIAGTQRQPLTTYRCSTRLIAAALALAIGFSAQLAALTISPDLKERLRREGNWEQFSVKFAEWQKRLESESTPIRLREHQLAKPATGQATAPETLRVCVLMVDFSDNPAVAGSQSTVTPAAVDQILFAPGGGGYGSMTDFYKENSYGQLVVDGDVYGWYRMPRTYATYTGSDNGLQSGEPNARTLAKEAILAADAGVDFSRYDNDGDGIVEAVFVLHAGPGAEESGAANQIWSHRWTTSAQVQTNDGVRCRNYVAVPEEVLGGPPRIGVFAHELGHVLGLPDLYDIGFQPSKPGLGRWSLMAGGSWNFGQRKPANFDAWSKHVLDSLHGTFGRTIDVTANLHDVTLRSAVSDSIRYRVRLPGANGREYFLLENRQQEGFDQYLPGSGLLVYHCDDNLSGSNDTHTNPHLRVSLEQADGYSQLESDVNEGDSEDPFPGVLGAHPEFTDRSLPSTVSWYGTAHQFSVWGISRQQDLKTISCNIDVVFSRANLELLDFEISDMQTGNGNGVLEPGELLQANFTVKNYWMTASGVSVRLTSPTPGLTIVGDPLQIPAIGSGQTLSSPTPIEIQVSPSFTPANARFDLTIVTQSPPDTLAATFHEHVGKIDILLVDADDSPYSAEVASYFAVALDTVMAAYSYWDVATQGLPPESALDFKTIIWFTGSIRSQLYQTISSEEVGFLKEYLDRGGHLFLTGQDIAEQLATTVDSTFLRDYLGVRYLSDMRPYEADGIAGNPVGNGTRSRVAGSVGASNQLDSDLLEVLPGSSTAFNLKTFDATESAPGGITRIFSNDARVVFLSFGLEAVTTSHAALGYDTRYILLAKVLDFLREGTATDADDLVDVKPLPLEFALDQNFPNPFNPSTTISFTVGARVVSQALTLEVFNVLGQRVATLQETRAQAGTYQVNFDAGQLASGVYFYCLRIGDQAVTRKMVLSK